MIANMNCLLLDVCLCILGNKCESWQTCFCHLRRSSTTRPCCRSKTCSSTRAVASWLLQCHTCGSSLASALAPLSLVLTLL